MNKLLLLVFTLASLGSFAQNVTIRKVELAGDKIVLTYDLEDSNPSNEYLLNLYASKDNYTDPLTKVKGDIGQEIKPGVGKKVEWSPTEEYGAYKGRISFEIRGKVFAVFFKFKNFDATKNYKRGKQYDILWKANGNDPISLELFKGNTRIQGEMNHPNSGNYTLYIPSDAKAGKDYRLKVTNTKSSDQIVFSPFFKVVPKVPLLVKVLPVVAVAGAAAALGSGGGGSGSGNSTTTTTSGGPIADPGLPHN
jgi:Ser-Thr-rich glycosyl-phosphatidyl-inositol-anchored membrane family